MKKNILFVSIFFNALFIVFGSILIHRRGGINFLATKLNLKEPVQENENNYYLAKKSIFEIMPNDNQIIFLGDSITEYCDWGELFGDSNIKNRGIGGDVIKGVIDRLDEVVNSNPKKIFLMIGTNDLKKNKSVDNILRDYKELVELILDKSPSTNIYLQSILPVQNNPWRNNSDIIEINRGIFDISREHSLTYINLFDLFKTDENELDELFSYDGLHINGAGYLVWKNEIIKYLKD